MNDIGQFTVHHLRFEVEALTPLVLPSHAGPSIRGALFSALQRHFCPVPHSETPSADHKAICPVCWLMATEKPGHDRGRDVPRPYTVEPPVTETEQDPWRAQCLEPGERFAFGLTLFAEALNLFPYLVIAVPLMGQIGMGVPLEENASPKGGPRRGQFVLRRIEATNELTGRAETVLGEGQTIVQMPDLPVTKREIAAVCERLLARLDDGAQLRLEFRTPTRIVDQGQLVHTPRLGPLFRRLLERLDALRGEYAEEPPVAERERLLDMADSARLAQDSTRWMDLKSRSRRLGRSTPVGGFVGGARYDADAEVWKSILPYLLWGQEVHVGKSATKGDGWYAIRLDGSWA
jgi:hypothetical protein